MEIEILKSVMVKNNAIGAENRTQFKKSHTEVINIIGSPGSGKTTLLESTLSLLVNKISMAVIEGDLYTSRDAKRLEKFAIPIVQINTEGGCHLDAPMIHHAIKNLDLLNISILFIENVGNLVCPAEFDLGETKRVLVYSITEGEDKPEKYRNIFETAHIIVINKIDFAEITGIDLNALENEIEKINPKAIIIKLNAQDPKSLNQWINIISGTKF